MTTRELLEQSLAAATAAPLRAIASSKLDVQVAFDGNAPMPTSSASGTSCRLPHPHRCRNAELPPKLPRRGRQPPPCACATTTTAINARPQPPPNARPEGMSTTRSNKPAWKSSARSSTMHGRRGTTSAPECPRNARSACFDRMTRLHQISELLRSALLPNWRASLMLRPNGLRTKRRHAFMRESWLGTLWGRRGSKPRPRRPALRPNWPESTARPARKFAELSRCTWLEAELVQIPAPRADRRWRAFGGRTGKPAQDDAKPSPRRRPAKPMRNPLPPCAIRADKDADASVDQMATTQADEDEGEDSQGSRTATDGPRLLPQLGRPFRRTQQPITYRAYTHHASTK